MIPNIQFIGVHINKRRWGGVPPPILKMKKIKLVLLCLIIVITTACTGSDEPAEATPSHTQSPVIVSSIPEKNIFELTSTSFFFANEKVLNGYYYVEDRELWANLIKDKYDIDMKVTSLYLDRIAGKLGSIYNNDERYEYLSGLITSGEISGLLQMFVRADVQKLMENGLILPLDSYLKDNHAESLPKEWLEAYSFGGVTWGIPSSYQKRYLVRYIRGDWLDNADITIPTTLPELYETLKIFTEDDPDGDGNNNTTGAIHDGVSGLEDIFASYDLRMNGGYFGLAWNPNTEIWEDAVLKPEMLDCIEFLVQCCNEGIISNEVNDNGFNDFERGYSGSYASTDTKYINADASISANREGSYMARIEAMPGISNLIDKNLNPYYTVFMKPYVLTANTDYPKSTVTNLIDVFMADFKGSMAGRFGTPGTGYEMLNDIIFYKTVYDSGSYVPYEGPGIIGDTPLQEYVYEPDYKSLNSGISNNINISMSSFIEESGMMYKLGWDKLYPDLPDYDMYTRWVDFKVFSTNYINELLMGQMSWEDSIKEYRRTASKMGMQEILDYLNMQAGKSEWQEY